MTSWLRRRRWTPTRALAVPLLLLFTTDTAWASPPIAGPMVNAALLGAGPSAMPVPTALVAPHNRIDGLRVEELDDGSTVLRLEGTHKPTFNVYRLKGPDRLVVDVASSTRGKVVPHVPLDTWVAGRVTVDAVSERGAELVRVVVQLKREASYIVVPDGPTLVVTVTPREVAPEAYFARKSAGQRRAEIQRVEAEAQRMHADAAALKREASALHKKAVQGARQAQGRATAAGQRATVARAAEQRAREAETRARRAEKQAAAALGDAKKHRFGARRALRKAQGERERAQKELRQAQATRVAADKARADADHAAKRALANAEKIRAQAQATLVQARQTARETEANAQRRATARLARAEVEAQQTARRTQADAERRAAARLAAAEVEAKKTVTAAQRRLRTAEAEAQKHVAAAKRKADAAAQARLAKAERKVELERRALAKAQTEAHGKVAEAERRVAQAKRLAAKTEAAAKAREARAHQVEAEARTKVARAEATAKAREAQAQQVEAKARSKVAQAQTVLRRAEDEAKRRLDDARRKAKVAGDQELARARKAADDRIRQAERDAERAAAATLRRAEQQAQRKLTAARKQAKAEAVVAAERELARVRTEAEAEKRRTVAQARRKAQAQAKAELTKTRARVDAEGAKRLREARARAAKTEAEAQRKLDTARRTLASADAEAKRRLAAAAQARADAKRDRASAAKLRGQAKVAMRRAEKAMAEAETERSESAKARKRAGLALSIAKRRARRAKRRGKLTTDMKKAVVFAEHQEKLASVREKRAHQAVTRLRTERGQLEQKLAAEKRQRAQLEGAIAQRSKQVKSLRAEVARAKKKLVATGGSQKQLASARSEAARVQAVATVLEKEVARLRRDANTARAQAQVANARVAQLRRSGAAQTTLAEARQKAHAAQQRASAADQRAQSKNARLAKLEARVERKRKEVSRLTAAQRKLETQGAALRRDNKTAQKQLGRAQARLGKVQGDLQSENQKLSRLHGDVAVAERKLAGLLASLDKQELERKKAEVAGERPPPSQVKDVRFEDAPGEERVIVAVTGPVEFAGTSLTPKMQMLRVSGASIPSQLERSLDATAFDGPVKLITSFREGSDVKIIVATRTETSPRLEERNGELVWHFPRARKKPAAKAGEVVSMAGTKVGGFATTGKPLAAMGPPANAPAADVPRRRARPARRRGRFRGERIDIELQEAPIKDVLLLFSDIGRVNIIAGRGVDGTVTMKLSSVPWDQALDIILRSLNLGSVREGNVIRVATLEDLEGERRKAIEEANARVQLKPLETRLVPVSYATAQEMVPKVQSVLSARGSVTPDARTNQLIIMDVGENIALAEQLVESLDSQTPQVLIEARIVEARTNFTRQLGIQWGFGFIASPGTGNPTGLLFPNSLGVGGGATGQPPDTRGLLLPGAAANPNYAVDLPAPVGTGSGGALGFSFGSISGNLNTNLRLSAAEDTGEVRIISAPKIVTLDNTQAQIEQGVQIPISQVSAQGVNTRFVNATLSLRVTPHVTNEGAVLMDVIIQKNEADFINTGARGDPTILTKQAQSRMLVNDNDTVVIGGIYTRNKAVNFTKVPWIADIPIIGWFFKSKSEADTRSETLIFLTPKIVNRASSIGG